MLHNPSYPMKYLCSHPKGTSFRVAMVTDWCFCLTLGRNRLQLEKIWRNNLVNWHETFIFNRKNIRHVQKSFLKIHFPAHVSLLQKWWAGALPMTTLIPPPLPWYCCPNTKDVQRLLPLHSFPTWSNDSVASNDIRCDQHLNMFFGSPTTPFYRLAYEGSTIGCSKGWSSSKRNHHFLVLVVFDFQGFTSEKNRR